MLTDATSGVAIAIVGSRALHGSLYGIATTDAETYIIACSMMLVVAVVAAWIPGAERRVWIR